MDARSNLRRQQLLFILGTAVSTVPTPVSGALGVLHQCGVNDNPQPLPSSPPNTHSQPSQKKKKAEQRSDNCDAAVSRRVFKNIYSNIVSRRVPEGTSEADDSGGPVTLTPGAGKRRMK